MTAEIEDMLIRGERIRLRPIAKRDMEDRARWYNDPEVTKTLILPGRFNLQQFHQWFEQVQGDNSRRDWVIETLTSQAIGVVGLKEINRNNMSCRIYTVIGERAYWRKGFGLEATLLAMHYGFTSLRLHKVHGSLLAHNVASEGMVRKIGFHQDGRLRDEYCRDGQFCDVLVISILRDEFYREHPELAETAGQQEG